jgi:hypothetical protein
MSFKLLSVETKLKYSVSLAGLFLSGSLLIADDVSLIKLKDQQLYRGILVACGFSLGIVAPKFKQEQGPGSLLTSKQVPEAGPTGEEYSPGEQKWH